LRSPKRSASARATSAIIADWKKFSTLAIDEHKARELEKLNRLELECWNAWHQSKTEQHVSMAERIDGMTDKRGRPLGEKRKSSLKKIARDGTYQFIECIQKCIASRCRILGIDEPIKVRHGGDPDAPPIQHNLTMIDLKQASTEELEALRAFRDRLLGRGAVAGSAN
jgi:hypothetical protein